MVGSFHDAEDAVQDAFLRAWRYRESLKEGAPLRPWLYRVATNSCLDAIARDPRRSALAARTAGEGLAGTPPGPSEVSWLQPFPDVLLEPAAPRDSEPEAVVLTRETIEIAFLTVIQLLTPQQRAALILRDVLGWSAKETAELLELSVAAANSALQRARATLRARLPSRKPEWPAGVDATAAERELLRRYVDATEKPDLSAFESLIREDAVFRMPPDPEIVVGREAILRVLIEGGFGSEEFGRLRCVTTRANRQPAVACYVRRRATRPTARWPSTSSGSRKARSRRSSPSPPTSSEPSGSRPRWCDRRRRRHGTDRRGQGDVVFDGRGNMYGLIGKMSAVPGKRDELIAILLDGVNGMPGCLSYIVAKDLRDENALWITEVWDSKTSHEASLSLPTVKRAIAKGRPMIAGFGDSTVTTPVGGHGLPAR